MCVCFQPFASPLGRRFCEVWPTEPRLEAAVAGGDSGRMRILQGPAYMQKGVLVVVLARDGRAIHAQGLTSFLSIIIFCNPGSWASFAAIEGWGSLFHIMSTESSSHVAEEQAVHRTRRGLELTAEDRHR